MSAESVMKLAGLVGADTVEIEDARDGWPGVLLLRGDPALRVAVHVGRIGLSHRKRDHVERRFQNPGQNRPLSSAGGALPLLVGMWEEGAPPVVVAMDVSRRMERQTRQSLFIRLSELQNAQIRGWSEYVNATGEQIYLFHPALFASYVRLHMAERRASNTELQDLITASVLIDSASTAEERMRRVSSALVRRAAFATEVLEAYGRLCAMCGLNLGLIEAAHLYPAHAPGSRDSVKNGVALCRNHHGAFDQHRIWVDPKTSELKLHPEWMAAARRNPVSRAFVESCLPTLRIPARSSDQPDARFLKDRYEYFGDSYAWARE